MVTEGDCSDSGGDEASWSMLAQAVLHHGQGNPQHRPCGAAIIRADNGWH